MKTTMFAISASLLLLPAAAMAQTADPAAEPPGAITATDAGVSAGANVTSPMVDGVTPARKAPASAAVSTETQGSASATTDGATSQEPTSKKTKKKKPN